MVYIFLEQIKNGSLIKRNLIFIFLLLPTEKGYVHITPLGQGNTHEIEADGSTHRVTFSTSVLPQVRSSVLKIVFKATFCSELQSI